MTVLHEATSGETNRLRRYARALTGSWSAADTLCRYAREKAAAVDPAGRTLMAPPVEPFHAVCKVWNSPAGDVIEKAAAKDQKLLTAEQRRVARMPRRVREVFLLTTIGGLSHRDAAKAAGISDEDLALLMRYARSAQLPEEAAGVIIIEDEALIARELESIVTELGHKVVGKARTRDAAVAMVKEGRPALVLADMQLFDESSGVDAVNDIIDLVGATPVIFITAFPARLVSARRPAPTFLVNKPYDTADVRAAVTEVLFFGVKSARSLEADGDGPPLVRMDC